MGSWSSASWRCWPGSGSGIWIPAFGAQKRANEGDLDGAIAELREHIEEKGPTQIRLNALGILLMPGRNGMRLPRCFARGSRWENCREGYAERTSDSPC